MYILRANINIYTYATIYVYFRFHEKKILTNILFVCLYFQKIVNCLARKIANKLSKIYYISDLYCSRGGGGGSSPLTPLSASRPTSTKLLTIGPSSTTGKMFVSMWTPTTCSIFTTITATHWEISISENVPQFSKFPRWKSCLYHVE